MIYMHLLFLIMYTPNSHIISISTLNHSLLIMKIIYPATNPFTNISTYFYFMLFYF